jgi:hypothetical protein
VPEELREAITCDSELKFRYGGNREEARDEQNFGGEPRVGIEIVKERKNYDAPSLKRVLRGRVCYRGAHLEEEGHIYYPSVAHWERRTCQIRMRSDA